MEDQNLRSASSTYDMCDSSFNCFTKNARDRKLAWAFQMALSGSYYIMDKARTQVLYYVKLTKFAKKHLLIDIFSAFQWFFPQNP